VIKMKDHYKDILSKDSYNILIKYSEINGKDIKNSLSDLIKMGFEYFQLEKTYGKRVWSREL